MKNENRMDWERNVHHFTPEEWKDDPGKVSPELILILDHFRHTVNAPVVIHCAWQQRGHAPMSYHYTGRAVDFHVVGAPLAMQYSILSAIRGIGGLGGFCPNPVPSFLHIPPTWSAIRLMRPQEATSKKAICAAPPLPFF